MNVSQFIIFPKDVYEGIIVLKTDLMIISQFAYIIHIMYTHWNAPTPILIGLCVGMSVFVLHTCTCMHGVSIIKIVQYFKTERCCFQLLITWPKFKSLEQCFPYWKSPSGYTVLKTCSQSSSAIPEN